MRTSCVAHPPDEPLIVIHQWQVDMCDGDTCAAALMSFFEYWHNIKVAQSSKAAEANKVAEQHGEEGTQDESLWQWHNEKALVAGLVGLYSADKIATSLKSLARLGAVTISTNPNARYKFDRTRFFMFHPEVCNDWLSDNRNIGNRQPENRPPSPIFRSPSPENRSPSPLQRSAITETTTETTAKTTPETTTTGPPAQGQAYPADFEQFWGNWPAMAGRTKGSKSETYGVWAKMKPAERRAALSAEGPYSQLAAVKKEGGRYVPAPVVWLRGRRWETVDEEVEREA